MAQIGWIDFSKRDRKKAQQLLSLIRPEGQLDELGIGYIRDGLANLLFPGISTIQTRAKYFFIIPNIFREFENLNAADRRKTTARSYLKEREHQVKNKLSKLKNYEEGHGVIGITLRERQYIKRNPSEIYWAGLQSYGFMNAGGISLEQYIRNLAAHQPLERVKAKEEEDDTHATFESADVIQAPVDFNWFEDLKLDLTDEERDFFSTQILKSEKEKSLSVMPVLIRNSDLLNAFISTGNFQEFVLASLDIDYKKQVKELLTLAHDFAWLMEGVHLLYNHILQQHFFKDNYKGVFEDEWISWKEDLKDTMINYNEFEVATLHHYIRRSRPNSELFVNSWWKMVKNMATAHKPSSEMLQLVKQREQMSKGKKSRLSKPPSANVDIELNKRIGLALLQYRYYNAKTIIKDILIETEGAASN